MPEDNRTPTVPDPLEEEVPTRLVIDTPKPKPLKISHKRLGVAGIVIGLSVLALLIYGGYARSHKQQQVRQKAAAVDTTTSPARSPRASLEAKHQAKTPRSADSAYRDSQNAPPASDPNSGPTLGFERSPASDPPPGSGAVPAQPAARPLTPEEQAELDRQKEEFAARRAHMERAAKVAETLWASAAAPGPNGQPSPQQNGIVKNTSLESPPGMTPPADPETQSLSAPPDWPAGATPSATAGDPSSNPLGAYGKLLSSFSNGAGGGEDRYQEQNDQRGKERFNAQNPPADDPYLKTTRKDPVSRYEIMAGDHIPAILQQLLISDLPGNVTALIPRDVYDSVTARYVLIPAGTKVLGNYNSNLSYAQSRIQVAWTRLRYPDGTSQSLDKMMGYSNDGASGLHDIADNHLSRQVAGLLLSSLLAAGVQISQSRNTSVLQYPSTSQELGAALGQGASQAGQQIVNRNGNLQPTNKIRIAKDTTIDVNKDMVFDGPYTPHLPPRR